MERLNIVQIHLQQDIDRQINGMDRTMKTHITNPDEDYFNESIITLLNGQQDLQKQVLDMMKNMMRWHEYDNLMWDIPIHDGKNMDLVDWLLQIEKVALLANSQEYKLAIAKSMSTPYKMLKRIGNDLSLQDIKWKLEEVYSPIAADIHTASDLHRNNDRKGQYHKGHNGFFYYQDLYNCNIQKCMAGAKTINTLAETFKLVHQSLLKLKKYKGLLYNAEC